MKRTYLFAAAALLASTLAVKAQDAQRPRGQGGNNLLFAALDTNKDGVLDADEIAKAPEALKKLDKNGDGKITREELRPADGQGRGNRTGANGERPRRRQGNNNSDTK